MMMSRNNDENIKTETVAGDEPHLEMGNYPEDMVEFLHGGPSEDTSDSEADDSVIDSVMLPRTGGVPSSTNRPVERILHSAVPQTEALSGYRECPFCDEG